jgi:protein-disulfide isomerase
MVSKVEPQKADCNTEALAAIKTLSAQLKVNSTPTLFFADGHRVAGVVPNSELEKNFPPIASSK